MKTLSCKKGQFSIIAALLVSIVLVTAIITTYSLVRNSPIRERPQILGSTSEMNLAIDHVLEFVVGYYGSILQVTGNISYAKNLAANYLQSSLENIAHTHPDWSPSFQINHFHIATSWFNRTSFSEGALNVTYSLLGLGISGIRYDSSAKLGITVNPSNETFVLVNVTRDGNKPYSSLISSDFFFYNYSYSDSTWELDNTGITINSVTSTETQTTYNITYPTGIDPSAYMLQVIDRRGIIVTASTFSHYTYTLDWNQPLYSNLSKDTLVAEILQNGTLKWLGQKLQFTTTSKPIPPIPVKAFRVNQTINGVNREVPFQIEDWVSNYQVPVGLTCNMSIFNNRRMFVFLLNHKVEKATLWWDGRDISNQTSYAWKNRYFNDTPNSGVLSNGDLTLHIGRASEYLYVSNFGWNYAQWVEAGSSPFLNDDDSSYIWENIDYDREGYFYFQDSSLGSGNVESAKIQFEARCAGDDYFEFRIYNGYTTYGWYSITGLPANYSWLEYDVSSILSSLSRVNSARIEVRYRQSGFSSAEVFIRRCRLVTRVEVSDFTILSTSGSSYSDAEFLRINGESPIYGADPSYVIYNGSVRDIVQQEAEWGGGIAGCPNLYAQIVLTLPANATYYTYALRTIFVNSSQSRTITDLSVLQLSAGLGQPLTENGTIGSFPIASTAGGLFYNFSSFSSGWKHHWSEFITGTDSGSGIMFTDYANRLLYYFDSPSSKRGGIRVLSSVQEIELNPIAQSQASFTSALDLTWAGAVVTFDGTDPIYSSSGSQEGLWVMVEHPPTVALSVTG